MRSIPEIYRRLTICRRLLTAGLACCLLAAAMAALDARLQTISFAHPGGMVVLDCEMTGEVVGLQARFRDSPIPFYFHGPGRFRAILGLPGDLKPGGYGLQVRDGTGRTLLLRNVEVKSTSFPSQYLTLREPKLNPQQAALVKQEMAWIDRARGTESEHALWQGPFRMPVRAPVTTSFGVRRFINHQPAGFHKGVDFAADGGTTVAAAQTGSVVLARYLSPYNANGNVVFLDHGQGVVSAYLHLSRILVREAQRVVVGQPLGLVGSSGRSTGPHLHWSLYVHGVSVDGLQWIAFSRHLR